MKWNSLNSSGAGEKNPEPVLGALVQTRAVTALVPLSPQGLQLCPGATAGRASHSQGNPFP